MNTLDFFNEIFELKDDRTHILVWDLKTKKSSWFKNCRQAAEFAHGKENIYVGVGLSNKNRGKHKRYTIEQVDGVPGFVVDIDISNGNAHQKKNLPKSLDEARSLVEGFGFDPTLIINSGNGIHCWWLFKEPEMFGSNNDREKIQTLSRRLHNTILERAIEKKLTIDNVSDLSRVLRPVGTINKKDNCDAVEVTAIRTDGPRFNPDDFEDILIDYEPVATPDQTSTPDPKVKPGKKVKQKIVSITKEIKEKTQVLAFDPTATVDAERFAELANVFTPTFWETWEQEREDDDALQDKSPSGYDMALADYASRGGWSDQEILNLMIAWRRKHGHDLHLKNRQKYIRTIIKAQREAQEKRDLAAIDEATTFAGTAYENRYGILNAIQAILDIRIVKIIKLIGDEIEYEFQIETEGKIKSVYLTSSHIAKKHLFEPLMIDAANVVIKNCSSKSWHRVKTLFMKIVEEREISKHHGFADQVHQWMKKYLRKKSPSHDIENFAETRNPFYSWADQVWYVDANNFLEWCHFNQFQTKAKKYVLRAFKELGIESFKKFTVVFYNGRRTTVKPWSIGGDLCDPPDKQDGWEKNFHTLYDDVISAA